MNFKKNKLFYYALIASVSFLNPLVAEIETVVLKWDQGFCSRSCALGLERQLTAIRDVAEVKLDAPQDQATLRWKPNARFAFDPIDRATRQIGVPFGSDTNEIMITVRGTIRHTNREVTLISIGDGTVFTILSPPSSATGQSAILNNIQTLTLSPDTRRELILAEEEFKIVTISGPLFQPERSPPNFIVAQQVNIPKSLNEGRAQR